MVGAVIARGERILATSFHKEFGGPHAEVNALNGLARPADACGSTLYASLEPCNMSARCRPARKPSGCAGIAPGRLLGSRSGRTVQAAAVCGCAPRHPCGRPLRQPGRMGGGKPLLFHAAKAERPFLALKLAVSLDGRIAPGGGRAVRLTGDTAQNEVFRLRAGFDAVLVGTRTWKADDPRLTARGSLVPRVPPAAVLLDRRGELGSWRVPWQDLWMVALSS